MNATPSTMTTTTRPPTDDRKLGWRFRTPRPRFVDALIRDKKLSRIDGDVLGVLLDRRTYFKDSAWCCKTTIAEELKCSERTVQRSLERLGAQRVIRQAEVGPPGTPDPDEPMNKTGWRIYFLWITKRSDFGPEPDRRPPDQRTKMSSPPRTKMSSPMETKLSSPPPCATMEAPAELRETEEREKDEDDVYARASRGKNTSSSSPFLPLPQESRTAEPTVDQAELAIVMSKAAKQFPEEWADPSAKLATTFDFFAPKAAEHNHVFTAAWLNDAIDDAIRKKLGWKYAWGTLKNWCREGHGLRPTPGPQAAANSAPRYSLPPRAPDESDARKYLNNLLGRKPTESTP